MSSVAPSCSVSRSGGSGASSVVDNGAASVRIMEEMRRCLEVVASMAKGGQMDKRAVQFAVGQLVASGAAGIGKLGDSSASSVVSSGSALSGAFGPMRAKRPVEEPVEEKFVESGCDGPRPGYCYQQLLKCTSYAVRPGLSVYELLALPASSFVSDKELQKIKVSAPVAGVAHLGSGLLSAYDLLVAMAAVLDLSFLGSASMWARLQSKSVLSKRGLSVFDPSVEIGWSPGEVVLSKLRYQPVDAEKKEQFMRDAERFFSGEAVAGLVPWAVDWAWIGGSGRDSSRRASSALMRRIESSGEPLYALCGGVRAGSEHCTVLQRDLAVCAMLYKCFGGDAADEWAEVCAEPGRTESSGAIVYRGYSWSLVHGSSGVWGIRYSFDSQAGFVLLSNAVRYSRVGRSSVADLSMQGFVTEAQRQQQYNTGQVLLTMRVAPGGVLQSVSVGDMDV